MNYFPHDTDAANDEKVEALRALYGNDGYSFFFILLERIYRSSSFELDVSTPEAVHILAKKVGVSDAKFSNMLQLALKYGLFDSNIYHERLVLTSNGIKRRSNVVTEKRKSMKEHYQSRTVSPPISDAETTPETQQEPEPSDEKKISSPISDAETTPETPQSKEKQSKEEKSKVKRSRDGEEGSVASTTSASLLTDLPLFDYLNEVFPKGFGRGPDSRETAQLRDLGKEISSAGGATAKQVYDAFTEACGQNKLHLSYVRAVLLDWLGIARERWKTP